MCGQLFLDTMHANRANLIMQYLSIRWPDLETKRTIAKSQDHLYDIQ